MASESLADVYDAYRSDSAFDGLRSEHVSLVVGEGSSRPRIMIVGDAPGAIENVQRKPFVGASGRVLRSFLADVSVLEESDYFLTNVIKYSLLGNRQPHLKEVEASLPYLRREYAAIGYPPVLLAVGSVAWVALRPETHRRAGIVGVAGTPVELRGGMALWPMLHPKTGLSRPELRDRLERDWSKFGEWFREEFG